MHVFLNICKRNRYLLCYLKLNLITIHSENKGIKEIEPIHVAKHMQAIILEIKIIVSLLHMNAYHNETSACQRYVFI